MVIAAAACILPISKLTASKEVTGARGGGLGVWPLWVELTLGMMSAIAIHLDRYRRAGVPYR